MLSQYPNAAVRSHFLSRRMPDKKCVTSLKKHGILLMILYRVIIFIDICIIMCIKLFHFILKIRTKQNIHNKNCDQDHRTNDAYNPTDQSCFRLISSCSSDFWCHRKTNDRCNPNDNCDWRAATTDHAYNCYDSKDHCCDRNSTCLLLLWLFYVIIFVTISSV